MLFLTNIEDITGCKDQAGAATGLPDMAATTVGVRGSLRRRPSFPTLGKSVDCTTTTQNPQTYYSASGSVEVADQEDGHGAARAVVIGTDTKDAVEGARRSSRSVPSRPGSRPTRAPRCRRSGRDPQSAYTNIVQEMKTDGSNYAYDTSSTGSTISLLQEAQLQGMDMSKVAWVNVTGYGTTVVTDNPSVWEGMYQSLNLLPFEEAKYNKTLAAFVKYTKRRAARSTPSPRTRSSR